MAYTTVRSILKDRSTTVVGSAPLSEEAVTTIASSDCIIAVNGGVGSVTRPVDIWLVNCREYDDRLYTNPQRWPEERKRLHEAMLAQGANRRFRHIAFIVKGISPAQTIVKLKAHGVSWRGSTAISVNDKVHLTRRAGVKSFTTAFNISAGLFGAVLALTHGARDVTLCGFSFHQRYAYLQDVPPDTRKHIAQDQEALPQLTHLRVVY